MPNQGSLSVVRVTYALGAAHKPPGPIYKVRICGNANCKGKHVLCKLHRRLVVAGRGYILIKIKCLIFKTRLLGGNTRNGGNKINIKTVYGRFNENGQWISNEPPFNAIKRNRFRCANVISYYRASNHRSFE